jgi:hypothetical protein
LDAHLNTIVDWATASSEYIGGTKTFVDACSCDTVVDSVVTCEGALNGAASSDVFTQTGATIERVQADAWKLRTPIASQTTVFPATDCVVSFLGPVTNTSQVAFDGRNLGWQLTFDGSYISSLNAERFICLPQCIPIESTIDAVRVYYTGQLTTTFPAGSRPLQGLFNKAQYGRPKYGGDFRVMSEPMDQKGDAFINMTSIGRLLATDRIIVGLKLLVSASWTCVVHKIEVDVSNVTRHAFDRGWV